MELYEGEHELAQFLEHTQQQELRTWERARSGSELAGFIRRRWDELEALEL